MRAASHTGDGENDDTDVFHRPAPENADDPLPEDEPATIDETPSTERPTLRLPRVTLPWPPPGPPPGKMGSNEIISGEIDLPDVCLPPRPIDPALDIDLPTIVDNQSVSSRNPAYEGFMRALELR